MRALRMLGLLTVLATLAFRWPDSPQGVVFRDDFNGENDGRYELNYTGFAQWRVERGSVDLIGTAPFDDFLPREHGMGVDLDGTTKAAGRLVTRRALRLRPGRYTLSFDLAGCPRPSAPNRVRVSLGGLFARTFTLAQYAPVKTYTFHLRVTHTTSARLAFDHAGGDNYGILLDNVELRRD